MMKQIGKLMVIVVGAGLLALAGCARHHGEMGLLPRILMQPQDMNVKLGDTTILTVKAVHADGYQWLRNGVLLAGQTNATLTLENLKVEDAGNYTCQVSKDGRVVTTRTASIAAYSVGLGGSFCVFIMPSPTGGTINPCPGTFAGSASYLKAVGYGWAPSTNTTVHTATDTNRSDTYVTYTGKSFDTGCAQTTVTVPHPPVSTKYRFTIYFPNNVPTNLYCISLSGFDP